MTGEDSDELTTTKHTTVLDTLLELMALPAPTGQEKPVLAVATRYTHSPFEMGNERDLDGALRLLSAFVTTPAEPLAAGPS